MKREFLSKISEAVRKSPENQSAQFTEDDITNLPTAVQNYFRYCGYIGKNKIMNAEVIWTDAYHKRNQKSNWMKLNYYQYNSAYIPSRIVYIYTKLMGLIPMNVIEEYQDGIGSWSMKLMKRINIIDAYGTKELNQSALVTFLSESLLLPSIAIAPYITWTEIDQLSAKAVLTHNGNEVSGIFTFNAIGEFIQFETEDRYNSEDGKKYEKCNWIGLCSHYSEKRGIRYPTEFKAAWKMSEGYFEYFTGRIEEIVAAH